MTDKIDTLAEKLDNIAEKVSDLGTKLEVHVAKFDAHIESEDERRKALLRNNEILQENTESLKEHMQRTDLLESYVKKLDDRLTPVESAALRKHAVAEWWKNSLVLIAKVGAAITAGGVILKALAWLLV